LVKYKANAPAENLKITTNLYECGDHVAYPSLNAAMATGRAVADMIAGI
jgi:predicted NAD/FAD-dependent oxidoreductase